MKKIIFIAITIAACACAFALDAEVTALEGKAQVSTNGTTWAPLTVGSRVSQGSTIQTGFKSQLKLKVKGSEITLDPMTRIKVDQLSEQGNLDNTVVSMQIGSLTSNVKKIEDRRAGFTVKGPAATASVRGTIVSEEVGYNRDTVSAIEHTTMVWPSSANGGDDAAVAPAGARAIAPGQRSSVDNAGGQRSPQSLAVEGAFSLGGAPASAAMVEGVAPAVPGELQGMAANGSSSGETGENVPATSGGVTITVTYSD